MHRPLSLRKNFSWTFIANVIYAICQWGMLTLLAKLGGHKGPEMIGTYSLAVAMVMPVTIFGRISLRAVFVTDVKNKYLFGEYFLIRLFTTVVTVLIVASILLLSSKDPFFISITIVVALSYGVLSIKELFQAVMQKAERMDWLAVSKVSQGLLSLGLFSVAIYFTRNLLIGVIALLVARCSVLVTYDIFRSERIRPEICDGEPILQKPRSLRLLLKVIWITLPLGIATSLIALYTSVPRYFMAYHFDEDYLGYFSAISALLILGTVVVQALGASASPRLAKYYAESVKAYYRLVVKLIICGFMIGLCGLAIAFLFGKFLLAFLFTPDFASYYKELNWIVLCASFSFVVSFLGYSLTAARRFKIQAVIWGGILAVETFLCYLFIPKYGMIGAAWAMAIALAIGGLVMWTIVHRLVQAKSSVEQKPGRCIL